MALPQIKLNETSETPAQQAAAEVLLRRALVIMEMSYDPHRVPTAADIFLTSPEVAPYRRRFKQSTSR